MFEEGVQLFLELAHLENQKMHLHIAPGPKLKFHIDSMGKSDKNADTPEAKFFLAG